MAIIRPALDDGASNRPVISAIPNAHVSLTDAYRAARAHRSGGFLFTKYLNDRLASSFAALAIRCGIHPSVVTLIDLAIAVGASVLVIAEADQARQWWLPGLVACLSWQLSYVLDCADGQVARASGAKSDFGARLDSLVDFLSHCAVICALLTVLARWSDAPIPLIVACAALWPVNLLIVTLARTDGNIGHSFTDGGHGFALIKMVRDTGFLLFVIGLWLFTDPKSIIYPVIVITAFNGVFLLASIGREACLSMRHVRDQAAVDEGATEGRS
jgi:phosphatidylglycerophosphate synthase